MVKWVMDVDKGRRAQGKELWQMMVEAKRKGMMHLVLDDVFAECNIISTVKKKDYEFFCCI